MKRIIVVFLLLLTLFAGCSSGRSFDARLSPVVSPYQFSIASWEVWTLARQTKDWFLDLHIGEWISGQPIKQLGANEEVGLVERYYDNAKRIQAIQSEIMAGNTSGQFELVILQHNQWAQAPGVENIIESQVRATLTAQGIFNPVGKGEIGFPPLIFRLEELPSVLVISPRDKIEEMRGIVLKQNLSLNEKEAIEAGADKLGVSSLVVGIGGMATYPSLIDSEAGLQATLETAAHEWLHQYLAFTPLGFRYVLDITGISRNYDIATMNESLASMFGKEIGALVYQKYYAGYDKGVSQPPSTGFDFNAEMRNIRKTVDAYLARGEIDQAETFMEQKRQELASKGYYIRKLNQAYFAFYGTYADNPAFLNPIGLELKDLRSKSASLKDFLSTVEVMTGRQDLTASVK